MGPSNRYTVLTLSRFTLVFENAIVVHKRWNMENFKTVKLKIHDCEIQ